MPILTFWVVTPSGASARAVLPLRKGDFGVVQGSKRACAKVIHKKWETLAPPSPRERPTARGPAAAPNRNPAPSCQVSVSGGGLSNRKERKERKEKTGEKRLAAPEALCSTRLTFAFFALFAVKNACRPARPGPLSPSGTQVLRHSGTCHHASGDGKSSLRSFRFCFRRARMAECIWLTRDSERSRVAPISFMVISS